MKYYVYVYLDPLIKGQYHYGNYCFLYEPFYVGKGCNNRDKIHLLEAIKNKGYNLHKMRRIKKILKNNYDPIILRISKHSNEVDALNEEIDIISMIGRRDLKTGPLTNMTDGGDGTTKIISSDQRQKISSSLKQYYNDHPEIRKEKSEKLKGHKQPKSQIQRRIDTIKKIPEHNRKFEKTYIVVSPDGESTEITGLKRFCEENSLNINCMYGVLYGTKNHYKGWKVFKS